MNDHKKKGYRVWIALMLLILLVGILLIFGGLKEYYRNFAVPAAPRHTALADSFKSTVDL